MTAIYNYLAPKPITPLTQEEEKKHFEDLRYMLIASVAANVFFEIITQNPYMKALRFGITCTSAFLFCELDTQKKNNKRIDYRLITISYFHLTVSRSFLFLAQAHQYFFVHRSVDILYGIKKGAEAFKSREFTQKIRSGVYALYYLRKSLISGLEYKRLLVKC